MIALFPLNTEARLTSRNFGDHAQIINPLIVSGFSLHEKGLGHFGCIFLQSNLPTWLMHYKGSKLKWSLSKRPQKRCASGIKEHKNYTGMPSGHTVAAWSGASYMRHFSKDYKWASIPLYLSAGITAYSRVHSKCHTKLQIFASIALVEALTYLNTKLSWSQNYEATEFSIGGDGCARISFKF